jgi:hypothetical protein
LFTIDCDCVLIVLNGETSVGGISVIVFVSAEAGAKEVYRQSEELIVDKSVEYGENSHQEKDVSDHPGVLHGRVLDLVIEQAEQASHNE